MPKSVHDILEDLTKEKSSLSECLRSAKLLAARLKLENISHWIELELKGYTGSVELPTYRQKQGLPQAYNPYYGWQPIQSDDHEFLSMIARAPIGSPISIIEHDAKSHSSDTALEFSWPAEQRNRLSSLLNIRTQVRLLLPPSTALEIHEAVRNLLIDWCLELEKSGIDGAKPSLSEEISAPTATDKFIINNYGSIGNVVGTSNASEINSRTACDSNAINSLISQIRENIAGLPVELRETVGSEANKLEEAVKSPKADSKKLQEAVGSLRKICESASGNLTAQGILALIRGIFGS